MIDLFVVEASADHADDACHVLRRSISEICGPDYGNDSGIMDEWLSNKTPQNLVSWIEDANNYAIVAVHQDAVVGFALLRGSEILLNYVVPEYLNQGVGYLMLSALERRAAVQGLSELRCMSTITARPFYVRNGFEKAGEAVYVGEIIGDFPLRKSINA